jgi:hypothetical protein
MPAPPTPPEAPEPCFDCECCRSWTASLQQLRDSITAHVAGEIRISACSPDCLVCGTTDWQGG